MNKTSKHNIVITLIVILSLLYSIVRYHIFKEVDWSDFPLYIFNKAISLSAVILFSLSEVIKRRGEHKSFRTYKEYAVIFAIAHIVISITIISPIYFAKFYSGSHFNLIGGFTLLFGIIAFLLMFLISSKYLLRKTLNNKTNMKIIINLFLITSAVHILVMGYKGWLEPNSWPGGLPPITMLSFLVLIIPFFVKDKLNI